MASKWPRFCKACGKDVRLKRDGTFRKHLGQWPLEAVEHPVCPMSGKVPE